MLTVNVKFVASELVPGLESGEYSIEDGSSVLDLLRECERVCASSVPENNLKYMYPLFNGKPVRLESEITESGTLHLCRVVLGG